MGYRISVDTGGTFTDVVVADAAGRLTLGKALTTPARSFDGLSASLQSACDALGMSVADLLARTDVLIYGTTRATNAIVEGKTARTAFLTTAGFPDILTYRQGGKLHATRLDTDLPPPYIPRRLTREIPERIDAEGGVVQPLDEAAAAAVLQDLGRAGVEALAVCLLWSTVNPAHEARLGEMIEQLLPGLPYTLSHRLNPVIREYPRASSAAIDASLKPLMQRHLTELQRDLESAGLAGELLVSTSSGGVMHVADVIGRPIQMVMSGPSMAPRAGIAYARAEGLGEDVIVVDTGGTTFDVSLVRDGAVKYAQESWLGPLYTGHNLGMSTVDVRSVGAGGGSIAWIDPGGLFRVGPQSAGSVPGPACYGRGGREPTVTDAAAILGYLDPDYFLGGRMRLDLDAARDAVGGLAARLGKPLEETAAAILTLSSETMIAAIQDITVNEGVNPAANLVVAGGGAAGLNILPIARTLGCRQVLVPRTAGALSACGAHYSDIVLDLAGACFTDTLRFDLNGANAILAELDARAAAFADSLRARGLREFETQRFVDARYAGQQSEIELALPFGRFDGPQAVAAMRALFDDLHDRLYAVRDPDCAIECVNWKLRFSARLGAETAGRSAGGAVAGRKSARRAYFADTGAVQVPVHYGAGLAPGDSIPGPAIVEEPTTTIVVYPGMRARVTDGGNYLLSVQA